MGTGAVSRAVVVALLSALAPVWLAAADEPDTAAADAVPPAVSDGPQVITPPKTKKTESSRAGKDGPAVELITGGNSTDGAARVGSLPILD